MWDVAIYESGNRMCCMLQQDNDRDDSSLRGHDEVNLSWWWCMHLHVLCWMLREALAIVNERLRDEGVIWMWCWCIFITYNIGIVCMSRIIPFPPGKGGHGTGSRSRHESRSSRPGNPVRDRTLVERFYPINVFFFFARRYPCTKSYVNQKQGLVQA